jgi:hypothetical protein
MGNRLILIAGSGRSGTSLFSGILKALGCHVPQPEVAADNTNPRGFGEPQWVVDFHTELLAQANVQTADARPVAWSDAAQVAFDRSVESRLQAWVKDEFQNGDHVAIKDPRLLWFLPLWSSAGARIGAGVGYASVLRHPREVVKSKQTYYGENVHPTNRTAGWINVMLYTERATRGAARGFVKYDDLLADWTQQIAGVATALDLDILNRVKTSDLRQASQLVDPSLRRSITDWETLGVHKPIADMAEELWELLDRVATKEEGEDATVRAEFDDFRERYVEWYDLVEASAQSSVLAARRARRETSGTTLRSVNTQGGAKQVALKGKRKAKRALRRIKKRVTGATKD